MPASPSGSLLPAILALAAAGAVAVAAGCFWALRRCRTLLAAERQRTAMVIRATQSGIFDWDVATNRIEYSERFREILGFPLHADLSDRARHFDSVHPEDRERARAAFVAHLREGRGGGKESMHPPIEYRMRRADGSYTWVRGTGLSVRDGEGRTVRYIASIIDISERKRQELEFATQRQRLELVVRAAQVGIIDWDGATRKGWYSERFKEMLGYATDADLSDWVFFDAVHPEDRDALRADLVSTLKGATGTDARESEYRLQRTDGSYIWVHATGLALRGPDGRASRFLASLSDVSEQRIQQEALRNQIKLTRDLIDANPNPVYLKDEFCRFLEVNTAYTNLTRVDAEKAKGRTVFDLYQTESAAVFDQQDRELLARGEGTSAIEVDYPFPEKRRHFLMSKTILKRADGVVRGLVGTLTEITHIKEIEAQLRESEERLRFWLENIPISIAIYDPEGGVIYLNPAFVTTFGWSLEEMRGQRMPFVPENRREQLAGVLHNLRTVGRDAFETERLTKDGRILDVYISTGMARASDGTPRATMVSLTDVTDRKRMEGELRASREEAMQAAQAKAAFLAAMSHEIRTPLNGVLGMAGLLEGTKLTPEQREYVETIQVSGDALLDVINDVLDYSKIESGRMDLEQEPLEPVRAIEESLEILGARARAKGLELIAEAADGVPPWVLGDFSRLRQVLVNLVSNAVKFTEAGEVVVEARPAAPGMIEFSVRDTGIGIPSGRIASLFEAFTQVDASTTRKYGGTGLGLAISRRLVEFMGGTLRVESTPGHGSTFSFTVRAEPCAPLAEAPATAAGAGIAGKRLLVVDDNLTNLRILSRQLERWGAAQVAARSAADALDRLASDRAFDAALFDYHMPGMDGVMLTRELRRRGIRFPVVLLSSSMYRRAEEAEAELFAAQLLKPIRQHQLQAAIAAAITGRRFDPGLRRQAPAESGKLAQRLPLRILVADDVDVNRKLTVALLRNLGYAADAVDSGRAAVAAASGGSYDLVLMDVQMPDVDGLEATRQIRERVDGGGPRIVALTASAMAGDRERCLAAGMDDYLSKPIQPLALRAVLEKTPAARAPQETGAIDWRRIDSLKPFDADGSMVAGAVAAFLADAPGRVKAIRTAHAAGDAAGVAQAAHALKGAAANIGAARLQELSQAIEGSARDGKLAAARKAVAALARSLTEARAALTAGKKY